MEGAGKQRPRILGARPPVQAFQKALDGASPVPADDRCRDLVADAVAEDRGVPCRCFDAGLHATFDRAPPSAVLEERDVLLPGKSDHDPKTVLGREIEEPQRRGRVRANRIDAVVAHAREIVRDDGRQRIVGAVGPGRKGAVRDTAHVELLASGVQELPTDLGPLRRHNAIETEAYSDGVLPQPAQHRDEDTRRAVAGCRVGRV
jgi:hypothetical protein